jgi:hypothetical protein
VNVGLTVLAFLTVAELPVGLVEGSLLQSVLPAPVQV